MSEAEAALGTALERQGAALIAGGHVAGQQQLPGLDGHGVLPVGHGPTEQRVDATQARVMLARGAGQYAGALAELDRVRRQVAATSRAAIAAGLSVQEVAALLGVPWATAYQWTAGR